MRQRLKDPGRIIADARLRIDDDAERMLRALSNKLRFLREKLARRRDNLYRFSPERRLLKFNEKLEIRNNNLKIYIDVCLNKKRSKFQEMDARLKALDPNATLKRGYSITRTKSDGRIVMTPDTAADGELLDITVAGGQFQARVEKETT